MDVDHVEDRSASALQQFTLLAKSAKGPACASLIGQVLDHPSIYVFGELLETASIQEVCPDPRASRAPDGARRELCCTPCRSSRTRRQRRASSCCGFSPMGRGTTTLPARRGCPR